MTSTIELSEGWELSFVCPARRRGRHGNPSSGLFDDYCVACGQQVVKVVTVEPHPDFVHGYAVLREYVIEEHP